jgi:hypothetical protein
MAICVCKYPLMITDKRDEYESIYISLPLEILDGEVPIPDMEVVKEKDFDDKMATYMKVEWQESSKGTKRYNVNDHIVLAGCPEDQLSCDIKSIFVVYHPIDEWNEYHMVELKEQKR